MKSEFSDKLFTISNNPETLAASRALVNQKIECKRSNFKNGFFDRLSASDIELAFDAIDETYFSGNCRRLCDGCGYELSFRLAKKMTHCGGKTTTKFFPGKPKRRSIEIAIAPRMLHETFESQPVAYVTGVRCHSPLDAMARVMEHEILHSIEMILWEKSSCHRRPFKTLAKNIFGHSESSHRLHTPAQTARVKHGIAVGNTVFFDYENRQLSGTVNHINRRATVLVIDSHGIRFTDGNRYRKFYVPIEQLRKAN